jgi:hypothetical protein
MIRQEILNKRAGIIRRAVKAKPTKQELRARAIDIILKDK